jgi:hypothetical protein
MTKLLRSRFLRIAFLNSTLFIVFGMAWISDKWPALTLPALAAAFFIAVGEAAVLYFAAREGKKDGHSPQAQKSAQPMDAGVRKDNEDHLTGTGPYRIYRRRVRTGQAKEWLTDHNYRLFMMGDCDQVPMHVIASEPLTWVTGPIERAEAQRRFKAPEPWNFVRFGENAFNIEAGAFVIEHFHGHTNIRVLDSTCVTVEDEVRGVKSKIAPSGVRASSWQ